MRYPLKKLGLPARDAQRLEHAGVVDSDYLLTRAATHELREQLAQDTGMPIAEMEKLGEFLLAMAQDRARQQGVAAEYILRHGDLRQELIKTARDGDMDLVVLGKPVGEHSVLALDALETLASAIEVEAGVPVQIV